MGVFSDIRNAKGTKGGNYFEPDHDWVVMINAVKQGENRKKIGFFLVEGKVVHSTCDKARPGADRTFYVSMDKDAALGNVKDFIEVAQEQATGDPVQDVPCDACTGTGRVGKLVCPQCEGNGKCSPIDEELAEYICSETQPYAGLLLALTTYNKPTAAGNPFTRHRWSIIPKKEQVQWEQKAQELGIKAGKKAAVAG